MIHRFVNDEVATLFSLLSFLNPLAHARASQMIADGVIDVSSLATRTIALQEVPEIVSNAAPKGEVRAIAVPDN